MEVLSSTRGDKYEACLVVTKFKNVRSCPSFITLKLNCYISSN